MFKLRDYQEEGVAACMEVLQAKKRKSIVVAPTGCHEKGYKVVMSDGSLKKVEEVEVGDRLMGIDSSYREVHQLCRGEGLMYKITLRNGISFTVNDEHILKLYRTGEVMDKSGYESSYPDSVEVTVKEYLTWAKSRKHLYKIKRIGYNTEEKDLKIDPYYIGLWLGDGTSRTNQITTMDEPIKKYLKTFSESKNLIYKDKIKYIKANADALSTISFTKKEGKYNNLLQDLKYYNLLQNKHIPYDYLNNSFNNKVKLLEGLIDSDGSLDKKKARYEITLKNKRLSYDVYNLLCSLGLNPTINESLKSCHNCKNTKKRRYFRISFRWKSFLNPILDRKKIDNYNFQGEGDMYSFSVEEVGIDKFYGFKLDKDRLYIDQNGIIQHNSGKSIYIAEVLKRLDEPTVILQPSKELLKQNYDKFLKMGGEATMYCSSLKVKTKNKQAYTIIEGKEIRCDEVSKFTFATVGSIKKEVTALKKLGVKTIIIDEVHLNTKEGSQMRKFIKDLGATNVLGLTATPIYLEGGLNGSRLIMINRTFATIFRSISHVTQIKRLVDKGFWTPLNYKIIKTDDSSLELNTAGSDYTEYSQKLYYESNDLKGRIVEEVKRLKKGGKKRILIFVPSIQEANELYSIIPNSAVVHSKLKPTERDFFIEAFTTGDIPVAVNCLDLDTEILTEDGWVKHNQMTFEHKVANWDNGKVYYSNPLDIIRKEISKDESMVSYESSSVNFRVTGNHDMIVRWGKEVEYKKEKAKDIGHRALFVPINGEYTPDNFLIEQEISGTSYNRRLSANTYNIKKSNPSLTHEECRKEAEKRLHQRLSLKYKNPNELSLEECELIGIFFGDGSLSGKRYTITQSLSYPNIVDRIDFLLEKIKYSYSRVIQKKCKNCSTESIKWTLNTGRGFGKQKCEGFYPILPYLNKNLDYIEYFSRIQIESFLKGLWLADGNHLDGNQKTKRGFTIHNSNKKALDKLQSVCVTRGIKCSIVSAGKPRLEHHSEVFNLRFDLNVTESKLNNRFKVSNEGYKKEEVWCVKSESGNIITRRKGKVVVLGNCNVLATGYDNPEIDAIITARPTSSIAVFYQQVGRGVRLHPSKKECVITDFSGNTERFGRVENITFEEIPYYGWGMFGEGDVLLSDYPIATKTKPTKQSLIESERRKQEKIPISDNPEFTFGKFSGRRFWDIAKSKDESSLKGYCVWIIEKYKKGEWTFYGQKGTSLKKAIYDYLQLPAETDKAPF